MKKTIIKIRYEGYFMVYFIFLSFLMQTIWYHPFSKTMDLYIHILQTYWRIEDFRTHLKILRSLIRETKHDMNMNFCRKNQLTAEIGILVKNQPTVPKYHILHTRYLSWSRHSFRNSRIQDFNNWCIWPLDQRLPHHESLCPIDLLSARIEILHIRLNK